MARISRLVLALALMAAAGCSASKRVGAVVIEGELPPELVIGGSGHMQAQRDSLLCKEFVLQNPIRKSISIQAQAVRFGANRYSLRLGLTNAPQGGFCHWTLRDVVVTVAHKSHPGMEVSLAWLEPDYSPDSPGERPDPAPEPVMATVCRPGPPDDPNAIDCKLIERTVPDFYGDKKFVLNVAWDPKYEPPVEQYVPSEPWQPQ